MMFFWTVSPGKWVLRNLFLGFIREEEAQMRHMHAVAVTSPRTTGNHPATTLPPPLPHSPQEQPATIASTADAAANASANTRGTSTVVIPARNILPALPPCTPVGLGISQVSSFPQAQLSPSLAATSITTTNRQRRRRVHYSSFTSCPGP